MLILIYIVRVFVKIRFTYRLNLILLAFYILKYCCNYFTYQNYRKYNKRVKMGLKMFLGISYIRY